MSDGPLPDSPERQLWCAVISLAASDYRAGGDLRRAVIRWMASSDFVTVVEMAGLDPADVANFLKRGAPRASKAKWVN